MKKGKIYIVGTGTGPQDLSARALQIVNRADVLIGAPRLLAMFQTNASEIIEIKSNMDRLINKIKNTHDNKILVVLTSGDPNFFGIAASFYRAFPKNRLEVIPCITVFQAAFAKIKEPWDGASFVSVHARPLSCLDRVIHKRGTYVVYCDLRNTPSVVAQYILNRAPFLEKEKIWIFENIGTENEKITSGTLGKLPRKETSGLAMMIIKNTQSRNRLPLGISETFFVHKRNMITKRDVRLMSIARLNLHGKEVLWDIGAGSGSVSIEAASIYDELDIYAVEKDEKRYKDIIKNIQKNMLYSITPLLGEAPAVLRKLPSPDAVFIGGSGGRLQEIMAVVKRRLCCGGSLVINCATIETLGIVVRFLKRWGWQYEVTSVQLAYMQSHRRPLIFRAENNLFIVHSTCPR